MAETHVGINRGFPRRILTWCDSHKRRTGIYPTNASGPVNEAPDETWRAIDSSLRRGSRDLKGSISLAGLLARQRGLRNRRALRDFTIEQILEWADAHYTATGRWPSQHSGAVAGSPGETWSAVDTALAQGHRGLAGGSSLAKILDRYLRKPERRPK